MQSRVDEYYRQFVATVAKHRSVPESAVRNGFGQGRLVDAERAKREGMVDGVATFDEVVRRLAQRIGQGTAGVSSRAAQLHARQRVIEALSRRPTSGSSRAAMRTAEARRVIELLCL